jgi:hypothetical protein
MLDDIATECSCFLVLFIVYFLQYASNTNAFNTLEFRVFWDVAHFSHVEVDRRFRGAYRLYHKGDE